MADPVPDLDPIALNQTWALWPIAQLRTPGMPFRVLDQMRAAPGAAAHVALDERIAAAIAWQNEGVSRTWLLAYRRALRAGKDELGRRGLRELKLIHYAQRYCAKNETIGFFGPVSWALLGTADAAPVLRGSPLTTRAATVCVEVSLVRAVIEHCAAQDRLRPLLPLRRNPVASVIGSTMRMPPGREVALSASQAAVWHEIDGTRGVRELAADDRYREAAESLIALGAVLVGPDVPMDAQPETALSVLADHLPDPEASQLRTALKELAACKTDLASAASAEDVAAGQGRLAGAFSAVLPDPGQAGAGRVFGRGLAYLESRSDAVLRLPRTCVAELGRPLTLVLDTAAWLAREVGECVEERAVSACRRLAAAGPVRLDALLFALAGELEGAPGSGVHEVVNDFQQRWLAVIGDVARRRVELRGDDIARTVRALFPVGMPAWAAGVQHSPDLLMRKDPDSGALSWVLGELHTAWNTLENRMAFATCSFDTAAMTGLAAADMRAGRVVTLFSGRSDRVSARSSPPLASSLPGQYRYWCFSPDRTMPPAGAREWASTQFDVVRSGSGLVARCPGWEAPITELLGDLLSGLVVNRFRPLAPGRHSPRVTIDGLVVARERWRIDAAGLLGGYSNPLLAAEHAARAVLAAGAPRHVFVLSPAERKPVYVDLESPPLQRLLAHVARRAARGGEAIDVAEMLPEPGALWIQTDEGPLTSEIRLTVAQRAPAMRPAWRALT